MNLNQQKVPIFQQNGAAAMSGTPNVQLRPQFRRQGSSYGVGHASPMAVIVVPNKIDYSMTKGGLRMWAVLLVFFFLCSSLYTIFSTRESSEMAFNMDSEEINDIDGEIDEESDEIARRNDYAIKDRILHSKNVEEIRKMNSKPDFLEENNANVDNDEPLEELVETENDDDQEEILLASIRGKSPRKSDPIKKEQLSEEKKLKKSRARKKVEIMENENDLEDDITVSKTEKKFKKSKRSQGTKVDYDHEIKDGESNEEDREENKSQQIEKKKEEETQEIKEEEEIKKEKDEEIEEEIKDEGMEELDSAGVKTDKSDEEFSGNQMKRKRSKKNLKKPRSDSSVEMEKKECKRKNCPPEYSSSPRMNLLKQKPLSALHRKQKIKPFNTDASKDPNKERRDTNMEESDAISDKLPLESDDDVGEIGDEDFDKSSDKGQRSSERNIYSRQAINNKDDLRYREALDKADHLVEKHDYQEAFEIFDAILRQNPDSPRAHFGRARAFDIRGEVEANKAYLDTAINEYQEVLDINDTPDALFRQAAYRLIDRARFRNSLHKALQAQRSLIDRYPEELQLQNDFGLTFLMMGRQDDAIKVFQNILEVDPTNSIAQAYYGYILKLNGDLEGGVQHMRKGLRANHHVIADPRFYYHFGDALTRLGRVSDAYRVYITGTKVGLFLSPYQRSLYNYDGLTARPWWSLEQTTYSKYFKRIERQWTAIREEANELLKNHSEFFLTENKDLIVGGTWSSCWIYKKGVWNVIACRVTPKTCELMKSFKDASNATKSEVKFSLLTGGTRIWPHCGTSNSKLRAHLGLVAPSEARIRVADETKGWKAGKFIIFDDSFEHELWFDGISPKKHRLILEFDLWHPEIQAARRMNFNGV